jgi:replicative DNA helicase
MIEEALLSKIVTEGDLRTPMKLGVTEKFFFDAQNRFLYSYIVRHFNTPSTRGNVPSLDLIKSRFSDFEIKEVPQDIKSLCEDLRQIKIETDLTSICNDTLLSIKQGPTEALNKLRDQILNIQRNNLTSRDVTFSSSIEMLKKDYEFMENAQGITGIPYPWPTLTEETLGSQKGEFTVFYGRPKSMKTWLLLQIAKEAYLNHKYRVVIFTWEMKPEQLMKRLASLVGKVNYDKFRKGKLGKKEKNRFFSYLDVVSAWEQGLSGRSDRPYLTVTTDLDDPSGGGVTSIRQKIEEMDPDLVCVDGFYQMRDDRARRRTVKWTNQTSIIQDLKSLALELDIPIIGTTQANRSGHSKDDHGTTDIAFSDAVGMYADCAIKVRLKERNDGVGADVICHVTAAREFLMHGFELHANPGKSIEEARAFKTYDELMDAVDPDRKKRKRKDPSLNEAIEEMDKRNKLEKIKRYNKWENDKE